jgi:hypothetical protein
MNDKTYASKHSKDLIAVLRRGWPPQTPTTTHKAALTAPLYQSVTLQNPNYGQLTDTQWHIHD